MPEDLPYTEVPVQGVIGHRQVTDAYLAQLARVREARLATFDQALAKPHGNVANLVPTGRWPPARPASSVTAGPDHHRTSSASPAMQPGDAGVTGVAAGLIELQLTRVVPG
jgi:hypothetical protein